MEPIEINTKLLEFIPKISDLFNTATKSQDGLDTGSTVVIEDVFMVYLKECIEKNRTDELINCTNFIEWLSDFINDNYAGDVLIISIFEYIHFSDSKEELEKVLGPKAKEKYDSIKWNV